MTTQKKDTLFSLQHANKKAGSFEFDQRVVDVFDDMVSRSVPGYQTIQLLVADLALEFGHQKQILDLGCSTGTTIAAILERGRQTGLFPKTCIGMDTSFEMIAKAKEKLSSQSVALPDADVSTDFMVADFTERGVLQKGGSDVVLLILSLQFIRPIQRQSVIEQIYAALNPGGALIVVEKTVEADKILNGFFVDYYHRFKKEMGYSDLEISNKREALENVLIPYQRDENIDLLTRAGFAHVSTFFQWFNFAGFLALK